jgi:hypothetical protein
MNTGEAKQILLLYRGAIDDSDPQFHVALDYAKSDPGAREIVARANQLLRYDPGEASRN